MVSFTARFNLLLPYQHFKLMAVIATAIVISFVVYSIFSLRIIMLWLNNFS
jgi:hypothetical protein